MRFFARPDGLTARSRGSGRDVGVMLTTDEHVRRLNRRYRQKDKPTDILSFPFHQVRDSRPSSFWPRVYRRIGRAPTSESTGRSTCLQAD